VFLAAPTSPPERLRRLFESSRGFVYAVSRIGITGERASLSEEAAPFVERIRAIASVPVVLGFGISTPEQVADGGARRGRRRHRQPSRALPRRVAGGRPRGARALAQERNVGVWREAL
jgi:hypothetical protein